MPSVHAGVRLLSAMKPGKTVWRTSWNFKLTAQLDLSLANTGSTPASAGVEAVPGSGTEVYVGGQLVGNGIFLAGDTIIGGLPTHLHLPLGVWVELAPMRDCLHLTVQDETGAFDLDGFEERLLAAVASASAGQS